MVLVLGGLTLYCGDCVRWSDPLLLQDPGSTELAELKEQLEMLLQLTRSDVGKVGLG